MSEDRPDASPYVLSRIYAQGWNAGKKMLASGNTDNSPAGAASQNPYATALEQSRWMKGFTDSFDSRAASFTPPGRTSRHNLAPKTKVQIS